MGSKQVFTPPLLPLLTNQVKVHRLTGSQVVKVAHSLLQPSSSTTTARSVPTTSARIPSLGHLLLALRLQQALHHASLQLVFAPAVSPLRVAAGVAAAAGRGRVGQDAVRGDQGVVGVGVVVCCGVGRRVWS